MEQFSDRYQALDVFIQDVDELMRAADGEQVPGATQYVDSLVFRRNGRAYRLQVFRPRRVFALTFDQRNQEWRAYDGGLIPWMKETLGAPPVLESVSHG